MSLVKEIQSQANAIFNAVTDKNCRLANEESACRLLQQMSIQNSDGRLIIAQALGRLHS